VEELIKKCVIIGAMILFVLSFLVDSWGEAIVMILFMSGIFCAGLGLGAILHGKGYIRWP
jgi:hypothetical protein